MSVSVVAIARLVGAAGEDVAHGVASELGYRYIDYQVVQTAAQKAGVSPETVSEAEHVPSLLTRILEALAKNPSMPVAAWADPVPLATSPLLTSTEYRKFVESVVRDLSTQGKVVIVGHGSAVILQDSAETIRVLVTGSEETRASRIMKNMDVDEATALKTVKRTDRERIDFFRRFYDAEWASPETYDLCINTDNISVDQAVKLIVAAASAG